MGAPVAEGSRIAALDAARGFALLGIFMVNILLFGEAFGRMIEYTAPVGAPGEAAAYYFVKIFCEGKFYPFFSMMFGIGLVLQTGRLSRERSPVPIYLRRLAVLAVIGLVHALLVWYGDILFIYSISGAMLLIFWRARGRTLLRIAVGLTVVAFVFSAGLIALTFAGRPSGAQASQVEAAPADGARAGAPAEAGAVEPAPAEAAPVETAGAEPAPVETSPGETGAGETAPGETDPGEKAPVETASGAAAKPEPADAAQGAAGAAQTGRDAFFRTPFGRLLKGFEDKTVTEPQSPIWIQTETEAYRDGPFLQAFLFRVMSWLMIVVISALGFGWHVVAMFFLGAALAKLDVFAPHRLGWHRRFVLVALVAGLPMGVGAALLPGAGLTVPTMVAAAALQLVGGSLMALGYLGAIALLVSGGVARPLTAAFANVGRMGLTNYLAQSVVATGIFYWWGLGLFGQTTRVERVGIVLAIYSAQIAWSWAWMRVFAIGPMEWVWRTLTYLKAQPLVRRHTQPL